jgi:endonuclease-3 related protein
MPSFAESYPPIVAALAAFYGCLPPSDQPLGLERFLAAYLNTVVDPRQTSAVMNTLCQAGLGEGDLAGAEPSEILDTLRQHHISLIPQAARLLRDLARWWQDRGSDAVQGMPTSTLRDELRTIRGIGAATADAILLHGLGRPTYPIDRTTYRILVRHGWLDPTADYDEARAILEASEPESADRFSQLGSWFARLGADACRARVAHCERCPLQPFLPPGGPVTAENE